MTPELRILHSDRLLPLFLLHNVIFTVHVVAIVTVLVITRVEVFIVEGSRLSTLQSGLTNGRSVMVHTLADQLQILRRIARRPFLGQLERLHYPANCHSLSERHVGAAL